jgi:hypothetical protein
LYLNIFYHNDNLTTGKKKKNKGKQRVKSIPYFKAMAIKKV